GRLHRGGLELGELFQSVFAHGRFKLLALLSVGVDFRTGFECGEEDVGAVGTAIDAVKASPVRVGNRFFVAGGDHFGQFAPLRVVAGTNMKDDDLHEAAMRDVGGFGTHAEFVLVDKNALVEGIQEFSIGNGS